MTSHAPLSWVMLSSAPRRIRLALSASILALVVSAIAFGITHSIHRAAIAEYQKRCSLYAVALASTSEAWLPIGGSTHEQLRYPLLALGVVYLRVAVDGEIVLDLRRPEFSSAPLLHPEQPSIGGASVVRFTNHLAIDVVVPHVLANRDNPEEGGTLRTLQFGIGATELIGENQQTTKKVALISLAVWVAGSALLTLAILLTKRNKRFATAPPEETPDAARRSTVGNLTLLPDELRFRVGDIDILLTPKQVSLLALLMDHPGRAFSDTSILEHVWHASAYANSSDVKQQVYLIRKRLRAAGLTGLDILVTVPGVGYKLVITRNDGTVDAPSTDGPHG